MFNIVILPTRGAARHTTKKAVRSLGYLIYQVIGWTTLIVAVPFFLPSFLAGKHRDEIRQRLGFYKKNILPHDGGQPRIWLHAASVGEVQVARALIDEIKRLLPDAACIVSTMTRQGQAVARQQLGAETRCIFAPLDLGAIADRALAAIQPDIYVCLETELWPAMLRRARQRRIQLVLLNGRLSERSSRRYAWIPGLIRKTLAGFAALAAITPRDAERFRSLGAIGERVTVTGNAKYDLAATREDNGLTASYRSALQLPKTAPVWVAGSTHTGEEALLIPVYRALKERLPDLIWIVAPRHLRRIAEIETLFREQGIGFDRRSTVANAGRAHDVILVDTMGELASMYAVATYIFCGGSLVERGGHNLFEAAMWGKPVLYGPSMKDFADAKALLEEAGAGFPISSAQEIIKRILDWAAHPEQYQQTAHLARAAALAQQGAAWRQAILIKQVINSSTQHTHR